VPLQRGNGYLGMLFMQAARIILFAADELGRSTVSAPGSFVLLNAYILTFWLRPSPRTVLAQERSYEARVTKAAA
jgi:hypothetical protein